jgi:hypothetical protein
MELIVGGDLLSPEESVRAMFVFAFCLGEMIRWEPDDPRVVEFMEKNDFVYAVYADMETSSGFNAMQVKGPPKSDRKDFSVITIPRLDVHAAEKLRGVYGPHLNDPQPTPKLVWNADQPK